MNEFDKRLKAMAAAEDCPAPEGFESRIENQLDELNGRKARTLRPARWALIAACLCVALVGTAFAVEKVMAGSSIREIFADGSADEGYTQVMQEADPNYEPGGEEAPGYVLSQEGMGVSLSGASREALAFAQKGDELKLFGSLEETEEFLGLDFYDNLVMDELIREAYAGADAEPSEEAGGVWLDCLAKGEKLYWVHTTQFAHSEDGTVNAVVLAEAESSQCVSDSGETTLTYPEGTELVEERYTTAWGGELVIIRITYPWEVPYTQCSAHFYAEGVRYWVAVGGDGEGAAESSMELLQEILDAFEFHTVS